MGTYRGGYVYRDSLALIAANRAILERRPADWRGPRWPGEDGRELSSGGRSTRRGRPPGRADSKPRGPRPP